MVPCFGVIDGADRSCYGENGFLRRALMRWYGVVLARRLGAALTPFRGPCRRTSKCDEPPRRKAAHLRREALKGSRPIGGGASVSRSLRIG